MIGKHGYGRTFWKPYSTIRREIVLALSDCSTWWWLDGEKGYAGDCEEFGSHVPRGSANAKNRQAGYSIVHTISSPR
jgi:hypothetical protein